MIGISHVVGPWRDRNRVGLELDERSSFRGLSPRKGTIFSLGFFCAIFWGVGTQFDKTPWIEPYWYVAHGTSIGDVVFVVTLMLLLVDSAWQRRFEEALERMKVFALCMLSLATILLASVAVNTPTYGGTFYDLMECLRFVYFLLMAVFVHAYVKQYGLLAILCPFVLGLSLIALDQLHHAFLSPDAVLIAGVLPMVRSPNVSGAVFGYGIIFCSLAILRGGRSMYLLAAALFVVGSAFTFSKGTWLMVIFGCAACLASLNIVSGRIGRSRRSLLFLTIVGALILSLVAYDRFEALKKVVLFKMESTEDIGSVGLRFNFALAGLYAMADHPLLGLGLQNYEVVRSLYPDLIDVQVENAHNVFFQIGAVGGVMSFGLLIWLFLYPFRLLSRVIPLKTWSGKVFLGATFLVMLIFANVQLQMIAQPVFWVFIGIVSGWQAISEPTRSSYSQVRAV